MDWTLLGWALGGVLATPLLGGVEEEEGEEEGDLAVVMPMAIPRDRLDMTLLNQRALNLFRALSTDGSRVFSIVRYYVEEPA